MMCVATRSTNPSAPVILALNDKGQCLVASFDRDRPRCGHSIARTRCRKADFDTTNFDEDSKMVFGHARRCALQPAWVKFGERVLATLSARAWHDFGPAPVPHRHIHLSIECVAVPSERFRPARLSIV